ncbi:MAG: hypothetical protein QOJ02_2405 [Acidobacteriota bacterium]|jgi:hypothetical protein|nr:hypothetical protein [Acidobacteriota bacterium]
MMNDELKSFLLPRSAFIIQRFSVSLCLCG